MLDKILEKKIWMPVLGVAALEILSYIATFFPLINSYILIILAIIFTRIAWKDRATALGIIVLELCIGSKGYLFALTLGTHVISIRYVLFAILLVIWGLKNVRHEFQLDKLLRDGTFLWLVFFLAAIILGFIHGIFNGNPLSSVFADSNGYFYLLLAPVFLTTLSDRETAATVLRYAVIGVAYLSIKTLFAYVVFSHEIPLLMFTLYKWIRLSGVGEITRVNPDFDIFRIFFQSGVWMVGMMYVFVLSFFNEKNTNARIRKIILVGILFSILVSFSRSFWVGVAAGGAVCLAYLLFQLATKKLPIHAFVYGFVLNTKYGLIALFLAMFAALLPLPKPALIGPEIFSGRATANDAAGSTRTEELTPLIKEIKKSPWLGGGFGTTVTYQSYDPRALEVNPSGTMTTAAFEWGYLDTITEIGIIGLLIFIAFLISIMRSLVKAFKSSHDYIYIGLTLGIISIAFVSIFSPYWNHPLGLGFLMLAWGISFRKDS